MSGAKETGSKTFKVAFITSSNLRDWDGIAHVIHEYTINKPENVNLTIVHSFTSKSTRVSSDFIKEAFEGARIIGVDIPISRMNLQKSKLFRLLLVDGVMMPMFSLLFKHVTRRRFYKEIESPDIVYYPSISDAGRFLRKRKGVLVVVSEHAWSLNTSYFIRRLSLKLIRKGMLSRNIDMFHLFPAQKEALNTGISGFTLPNGVDTQKFVPAAKSSENLKILFFARLEPCKGIETVLAIWSKIKDKESIEFTVMGSGSMKERVQAINDNNFHYLGFVEEEKLPDVIAHCDILVYPSTCDTFSLVVLQALSCGLYVITNDLIARNFVEFERIGQLISINNSVNSYIEEILNFKERKKDFSKTESRSICESQYDWSAVSHQLYDILIADWKEKVNLKK